MRFSVVVPIFNRKDQVRASLETIWAAVQSYGDAELILVDNGSNDGTWEMIQSEYGRRAIVRQVPHALIGALRNHGAALASGEVLSFIDSDCLIGPHYFHEARTVLESTSAAATGSMYDLPPSAHWIEETWQDLNYNRNEGPVTFISAGNLVVLKQVFEAVDGFDETLETGEDAEFCKRLVNAGNTIYQSRRVSAVHLRNVNSIRVFFEKQYWYGLGMLGTPQNRTFDKPFFMTVSHGIFLVAALINLLLGPPRVAARIAISAALVIVVPAATVLFRFKRRKSAYRPIRSTALYELYFVARVLALIATLSGRGR